jgi:transketolase N-terminal domain/subunit
MLGIEEDEDEEGCVNMIMGEGDMPEGEEWSTSDNSWREMECEDD